MPGEDDADRSEDQRDQPKRLLIRKAFTPLVAFLAGPAIVVLFWALGVFVFERNLYVTNYERIDELIPALPIGFGVGALAAGVVAMIDCFSDRDRK